MLPVIRVGVKMNGKWLTVQKQGALDHGEYPYPTLNKRRCLFSASEGGGFPSWGVWLDKGLG